MNFGRLNTEIGRKMADGQLLFLALSINYYSLQQCLHGHNKYQYSVGTDKYWYR